MTNDSIPNSSIRLHFRQAKTLCGRYDAVKQSVGQEPDSPKSYAQVESFVGQQVVGQNSGELKLKESKPFRITARFSQCEREILVRHAKEKRLTISEYIRACVLEDKYIPSTDPVKRQLLLNANIELSRQGNNLNQIARQLNAGLASSAQADAFMERLSASLATAHEAVRQALTNGRGMP